MLTGQVMRTRTIAGLLIACGACGQGALAEVAVTTSGLAGDGHAHAKHNRPERAASVFDVELLRELICEGFPLTPGAAGENLTIEGLDVQSLPPGTILEIGDDTSVGCQSVVLICFPANGLG